jgi:hypothetical protein
LESKYRIQKLNEAAQDAMNYRHKLEKSSLKAKHKVQLQAAEKISKSQLQEVAADHKKAWKNLKERHAYENKYPLGDKDHVQLLIDASKNFDSSNKSVVITKKLDENHPSTPDIDGKNMQKSYELHKNIIVKFDSEQNSSFQKIINQRSAAFEKSIHTITPTSDQLKINNQTVAFLNMQGIDIVQFQEVKGLPIQHQLTHELVDVLDTLSEYALRYHHEVYQTDLTKYCVHLASLSQQSNMQGALEQAIDGANCCHGIQHYLEGMVTATTQAYQQFQTALDYFDIVLDRYADLIVQHVIQGAAIGHGLDLIVAAGMITAPTTTIALTACMIGSTAYVMAPVCLHAYMQLKDFGGACITGNWEKVRTDLDQLSNFISKSEIVAWISEFVGGTVMPTPHLYNVVELVLSLRPVITSIENASGEIVRELYVMTKNNVQKVYTKGVELLQ